MEKIIKNIFKSFIEPPCTIIDNISDESDEEPDYNTNFSRIILISAIHRLFNNGFNGEETEPLSENKFNSLPTMKISNVKEYYDINNCIIDVPTSCCICQNNFDNETDIILLPNCKHIYHKECIKIWLTEKHHVCPTCRTDCN